MVLAWMRPTWKIRGLSWEETIQHMLRHGQQFQDMASVSCFVDEIVEFSFNLRSFLECSCIWDWPSSPRCQVEVRIAGRVKSLRSSGAKLKFYDLTEGEDRIQVRHFLGEMTHRKLLRKFSWKVCCCLWYLGLKFEAWEASDKRDVSCQVMCTAQMHEGEDFKEVHANIHRGVPCLVMNSRYVLSSYLRASIHIGPFHVTYCNVCMSRQVWKFP